MLQERKDVVQDAAPTASGALKRRRVDEIDPGTSKRAKFDHLQEIDGDLCDPARRGGATWIVQQCNTVTTHAKGLALRLSTKYAYADVYSERKDHKDRPAPGTLRLCRDESDGKDKDSPTIACLFAQRYPGQARYANDSRAQRVAWFRQGLAALEAKLVECKAPEIIAFPVNIGCHLAGGHWPTYRCLVAEFAERVQGQNAAHKVILVKLKS